MKESGKKEKSSQINKTIQPTRRPREMLNVCMSYKWIGLVGWTCQMKKNERIQFNRMDE